MLKQRIRRSQWTKMVTTEEMIKRMNAMDGMEEAPTQEDEATLVEDGDGELPPTEKNAGSVVGTIEASRMVQNHQWK
jgi:hypothetical protein